MPTDAEKLAKVREVIVELQGYVDDLAVERKESPNDLGLGEWSAYGIAVMKLKKAIADEDASGTQG